MNADPGIAAVGMHEAKTRLSQLVDQVERGVREEVVISRNGRPVAKLVPFEPKKKGGIKFGLAKGMWKQEDVDWMFSPETEAVVQRLFDESLARDKF